MHSASLYNAIRDPVFRLLNAARLRMQQPDFHLYHKAVRAITFLAGHNIVEFCYKPDLTELLHTVLAGINADPQFQAEFTAAIHIPEIAAVCSVESQAPSAERFIGVVLYPFLFDQLEARLDNVPDQALFDEKFKVFEERVLAGTTDFTMFTPLFHFGMEFDEVVIGPYRLRKLTPIEVAENVSFPPDEIDAMMILTMGAPRYGAEKFLVGKVGTPLNSDEVRYAFRPLMGALRVLHEGWTTQGPVTFRQFGGGAGGGRIGDPIPFVIPRHPGGGYYGAYYLRREDIAVLERLWASMERQDAAGSPYWSVALGRFSDAVNRDRSEEMLVDCWIACESLLGEEVEQGELSYRLGLRLSHLLESDPAKRSEVRQLAREAYRFRGRVVHGSGRLDQAKLYELASEMVKITRRALQRCLLGPWATRSALVKDLELAIVGEVTLQPGPA